MATAQLDAEEQQPLEQDSQEALSSIVKDVHSVLRARLASGIPLETVWSSHIGDTKTLSTYATAMCSLATGPWKKHGGGRIQWCVDACREYFHCLLEKLLKKDMRRFAYGNLTQLEKCSLPQSDDDVYRIVTSFHGRQLRLLDVGSCYNPFLDYQEFEVTAIDIAPAVNGVYRCDFLKVPIVPKTVSSEATCRSNGVLEYLTEDRYDVVVFSLLLSYFPSTEQRMLCCINAHKVLLFHGILLIITADSSHQNKHVDMMKSWCTAIEKVGFHRWKYVKDVHLHCMGFRKTKTEDIDYAFVQSQFHSNLFIIQDNNDLNTYI